MLVIPSLDLQKGRSRLVWWPGASTGLGAPTDRPGLIAEALVAQGAPAIHLVDLDGAQQGRPVNLEAIGGVARAVAKPLQVAGGIDGPEQIEMAFAAGATRVVLPLWAVVEDRPLLVFDLAAAGVRRFVFSHLPAGGAAQLVASLTGGLDADVLVAGGVVSLDEIKVLRDVGVSGVILGEALFTGQLDLGEALRSAA
jgi:phosphoribosylformimino-5-aminoimidazole carboxamide ribotide isomerase